MFKFTFVPANFLTYKPIVLKPGDVSCLKLGRGDVTKIKDHKLSRSQVEINCDFNTGKAALTVIGAHSSAVNSVPVKPGQSIDLEDGAEFELLKGKYKYKLKLEQAESILTPETDSVTEKLGRPTKRPRSDGGNKVSAENGENNKKLNSNEVEKLEANASVALPASAFLDGNEILPDSSWTSVDDGKLLIFTSGGVVPSDKIAAFDLDGTLIATASGKRFPKDADDWKILFPEIPKKLKSLIADGFKIVIVTNQAGIANGSYKVGDMKRKIKNILSKFNIPAQVFVSTGKTAFRKPSPNIWSIISHELNSNIPVDMENSFFCGDAAGREDKWAPGKKKDHSIADRLFALNVGLRFYTPEEYFLAPRLLTQPVKQKSIILGQRQAKYKLPDFDPKTVAGMRELLDPPAASITSSSQEVIIMVGAPGSGKSHFAKSHLVSKGYRWINRDTLKDWKKCVAELEKTVREGGSVVVDNTSPDKEARAKYVKAVGGRCPVRCFVMNTPIHHAKHNVKFREFTDSSHLPVPDVVLYTYRKNYVEPTLSEGFSEIVKVNFVPNFSDPALEQRYSHYLLEH